jgi:hypothetical protein
VQHFDWVWLSTDTQVTTLLESYRRASLATKLLGRFDFPDDVAHIRGLLMPWARIPLIFVAEGALTVDGHSAAFVGRRRRVFGWRTVGIRSDLSFAYSVSEIISVEAADMASPVARFFDIPFTRMRTAHPAPLDNFLLCVGGRLSMPTIRAQSIELRHRLQEMARRSST